jgi:hypothetical protein
MRGVSDATIGPTGKPKKKTTPSLHRGRPGPVNVLKQLAEGHPDAHPTKAAQESLERMLSVIDPFGETKDP